MSQLFNIALIGVGGIARAHQLAAAAAQGIELAAVVDTSEAARSSTTVPAFASVKAMLAEPSVRESLGGAVVCTPPSVRDEVIAPLLEAGVAVLCEKPLARTEAEARSLADLADRHPRVATAVGYCHRFTPAVLEMKRRLDAGELGTLVRFENTFACWHPTLRDRWMSDPTVSGGGSFIDTGCHSLDLFQFLCGEGGTVGGAVFHHEWPGRGDSNATVLLKAQDGAAGVIASGWQEPDRFTLALVGTRALVSYDYARPVELFVQPSHDAPPQSLTVESHDVRFQRQLEQFAKLARGGASQRGDLPTFAQAAGVARLVDKAGALGSLV